MYANPLSDGKAAVHVILDMLFVGGGGVTRLG